MTYILDLSLCLFVVSWKSFYLFPDSFLIPVNESWLQGHNWRSWQEHLLEQCRLPIATLGKHTTSYFLWLSDGSLAQVAQPDPCPKIKDPIISHLLSSSVGDHCLNQLFPQLLQNDGSLILSFLPHASGCILLPDVKETENPSYPQVLL